MIKQNGIKKEVLNMTYNQRERIKGLLTDTEYFLFMGNESIGEV